VLFRSYWDGTKLTFDDVANATTSKHYQGVFFKWGSLCGIDPTRVTSGDVQEFVANTTTVYKPNSLSTPNVGWTPVTYASYGVIPYMDETTYPFGPFDPLYDPYTPGHDYFDRTVIDLSNQWTGGNYVGDICKFLTENGNAPGYNSITPSLSTKWRMPTSAEYGNSMGTWASITEYALTDIDGWPDISSSPLLVGTNIERGIFSFNDGVERKGLYPRPFFPPTGYRDAGVSPPGKVFYINSGRYWNATAGPYSTTAACARFENTIVIAFYNEDRANALPVRCIKE
jgi:hypothetical protein